MVKLTVLYGHPEDYGHPKDPAAFEDHYENTHLPLVDEVPDLQRFEAGTNFATGGATVFISEVEG